MLIYLYHIQANTEVLIFNARFHSSDLDWTICHKHLNNLICFQGAQCAAEFSPLINGTPHFYSYKILVFVEFSNDTNGKFPSWNMSLNAVLCIASLKPPGSK